MKGVTMIRFTFYPEARCVGASNGGESCGWKAQGSLSVTAAAVRAFAQRHVKATGHTVLVDITDRTDYSPEVP